MTSRKIVSNRPAGAVILLSLILILGACAQFENGVVDRPLPNDQRLIGHWEAGPDRNERDLIRVTETTPDFLAIDVRSTKDCGRDMHLVAIRTEIGGRNFLDLITPADAAQKSTVTPVAYALTPQGEVSFAWPLSASFEPAIESGELAGRVRRNDQVNVTGAEINASTAELRDFLAKHSEIMAPPPVVARTEQGATPGFLVGLHRPVHANWVCPAE